MTTMTTRPPIAAWLRTQLRELLHLPALPADDASPAALGLTSLGAVTLQYRLMRDHHLTLTLDALMSASSLADLALQAENQGQA